MTDAGSGGEYYLAGETVEGWRALSLRNLWTVEDIARLLKTGQNRFATVSGRMVEVIHHSSQHFTDQDLTAIATYLKSLPPGPDDLAMPALPAAASNSPASDLFSSRGGLGYVQFCADCHRPDGAGVMGIFPPLRANPAVAGSDPSTLIHIVLTGSRTAGTSTHPRVYTMPAFSQLSDQELAEILSFLRADWGNDPTPILTSDVRKLRAALGNAAAAAAEFGTPRLADMLSNRNARQLVRGMLLQLKTRALLPQNVGDDLNCTSCHLNAGTVADSSPFVGVSAFFPSYAARSGTVISLEERINDCLRRSMNGTALPADSADMKAMVAYFDWMKEEARPDDKVAGRGVGKVDMALKPNVAHGGEVYAAQCAVCHGQNGEGLQDDDGRLVFPPLWGDRSFNVGADMARTSIAAGFVSRNMPVGFHEKFPLGQGGLSDQDAIDVAEYFTHKPRPDFPDKVKDWPKDPKPTDARQ